MTTTNKSIRTSFGDDHAAIEQELSNLADTVEDADFPTIQRALRDIDQHLREHFEAEERHMFPRLEAAHKETIRRLREEHEAYREALDALIIQSELHTLRKTSVDQLIAQLRDHARREDETLYAWTDAHRAEARSAQVHFKTDHATNLASDRLRGDIELWGQIRWG